MPVRVLHLIEDLGAGGAERLLFVNLSRLDRQRFSGAVCHLYDRALHWRQPILDLGYPVTSLGLTSMRDLPRGVMRLVRLLKRHPVDLIHTHLYAANLVGRLAAAMAGVPVVSSIHNPDYEPAVLRDNPALFPAKVWALNRLDRWTIRFSRPRFVAVSEYVRQSAVTYLGIRPERTTVIYNPIDFTRFRRGTHSAAAPARLRRELDIQPAAAVLLSVARLDPQKGLRYLVEALPAIVREFPGTVAVFVGGGAPEARATLENLADTLGVRGNVRFAGVQTDVTPYLETSDVFVLPSLYEGLGIALVEAMAMERPCVASRTTAIPEVVADGVSGLLVPPADAAGLAAAILSLLRDPALRARMGVEGRRIAQERFDVTRNIHQLEAVYESAAREKNLQ
jgi:glycosyltransferase involved in cell wall biosynthesis